MNKVSENLHRRVIEVVDSQYMRNFLMNQFGNLGAYEYMEIISKAPVSLERKISLLHDLSEADVGTDKSAMMKACCSEAETALNCLYHLDGNRSLLEMLLIDMENAANEENQIDCAKPYLSFHDALSDIQDEYIHDSSEQEISELDRTATFYYILNLYHKTDSKKLQHKYTFAVTPTGSIQYFVDMGSKKRLTLDQPERVFEGRGMEHMGTPYQIGDILYIDCRPYLPPAYCLVYYISPDSPSDCCGVRCLYLSGPGLIREGAVKHGDFYPGNIRYYSDAWISPLFRAELYEGDLPKEYSLLKPLSDLLKRNGSLSKKIDRQLDYLEEPVYYKKEYIMTGKNDQDDLYTAGVRIERFMEFLQQEDKDGYDYLQSLGIGT